ncbi:LPS assembly lipoprotein LptE [Arenibacterium halophilum]|jgi:LPS-assembly lipoprotein|uniref:LPS-assembly lipoprotein n=1 Tax=Arenibacterium halophilum TaxID=2583821 RepID=A0ABY2X4Z5_9RHOB|nr:LPS assembly lipoprotein LptE [Arenibacterium halophilum]TMV10516.1 hypothetical protein FGK64_17190 [Arenibacterium halophilum]
MLSSRHLFVAFVLTLVAACGFQPVYGPGGAGSILSNEVEYDAPATEESYILVRELEQRLGRADTPLFHLALTTTVTVDGQAITAAGSITRFSMVGDVRYVLSRSDTGEEIARGRVENFTGYSATGTTVATLAAETDARERLMRILAEMLVTRLYTIPDMSDEIRSDMAG